MLRLPPLHVARPERLEEALRLLGSDRRHRILAGGTDLLAALKQGHGGTSPSLLSLASLPLAGFEQRTSEWKIGATTTLWDLVRWPEAKGPLASLAEAARAVAAPPIQTRATLGGNLCLDTRCVFFNQSAFWRSGRPACYKAGGRVCHVAPGGNRCLACHQADLPPVLAALGARVEVASLQGARTLDLEDLYSGDGARALTLGPGDLITGVCVPTPPEGAGAAHEKVRARRGLDFPAVSAAVYLERATGGACREARVALGAVGSAPIRVAEAETILRGSDLSEDVLEQAAEAARRAARPAKNVDLTPGYRRQVAGVLVARAAHRAWEQTGAV